MHSTNKAFERYFQIELDDVGNIYQNTKRAAPEFGAALKAYLIKIPKG